MAANQRTCDSELLKMKKKNYAENSEEDNEFDVDEPEEIQNNASDDDWTPDKDTSGGRRTSSRLRNFPPRARAPIIDPSSTEEEGSDEEGGKRKSKGKGRGRQPAKKQKVSSTSTPSTQRKSNNVSKTVSSDSEPSSTTITTAAAASATTTNNSSSSPAAIKVSKDFTSGAFIVLKTEVDKETGDPPLWKIDGKALLQKYIPFEQDGKTLYKNTSVYSGWTINNKNNYYPVTVIFKQQTRKEHIVEFNRSQIKRKEPGEKVADNGNDIEKDVEIKGGEKDNKKEGSENNSKKNDNSDKKDSPKTVCGDVKDDEKDSDEDEDRKDEEDDEDGEEKD